MPPINSTNMPHHQKPKKQSVIAQANITHAMINLKIFNIICNPIK